MDNREQFETVFPKEVKAGNFTEVFYTENEYEAAFDGWQACAEQKDKEIAELKDLLTKALYERDHFYKQSRVLRREM